MARTVKRQLRGRSGVRSAPVAALVALFVGTACGGAKTDQLPAASGAGDTPAMSASEARDVPSPSNEPSAAEPPTSNEMQAGGLPLAAGATPGSEGLTPPTGEEPVAPNDPPRWVGTWATGPQLTEPGNLPPAPGLAGNTLRQKVFATISGSRLRVLFSNEWGEAPVTFESVRLAAATGADAIDPNTDRALLFGGNESVTIAAGQSQFSDPLDYTLQGLTSLAISIHFGSTPSNVTGHPGSRTTSYLQSGDAVLAQSLPGAAATDHWYFIAGVDIEARAPSAAVVTLGDSITDGRGSTTNGNDRWPDQLARRLRGNPATLGVAVLNQGIGGNAVVSGGLGPTAIERFQRDVLDQRGVRWVIVLEGVNDIGGSTDASVAARLIDAYQGFITSAHERGLLVYGVPILPFGGSSYDSPEHEAARQTVNEWVRTSGSFDAVIGLDAAVADPNNPRQLLVAYDTGDHLHLNAAGYQRMADAIELTLFQP